MTMHQPVLRHRLHNFLQRLTALMGKSGPPATVVFDRAQQILWRGEGWAPVPPTAARILMALLDHSGAIVSESTLIHAGWQGEPRAPADLYKQIHALRLLLETDPHHPRHLLTRRGAGYFLQGVVGKPSVSGAEKR